MAYIGTKPADKPLTSADITDGIITTAKIADGNITSTKILDGTILNADINASAAIAGTKISGSFGKVLQVVNQFYDTQTSINTTSFTDTGMTATITPTSTSNKVLVSFYPSFGAVSNAYCAFKLFRDSTEIGSSTVTGTGIECFTGYQSRSSYTTMSYPIVFLDSPSTTSATTYKLQVSPMRTSSEQFYLNRSVILGDDNQFRTASNTILMEIAG
jgi:hypothetical protein